MRLLRRICANKLYAPSNAKIRYYWGGGDCVGGQSSIYNICVHLPGNHVTMAERQQRQGVRVLCSDRNLSHFVLEGRSTGKQLGSGSYGSVEEVKRKIAFRNHVTDS